MTNLSAFYVNGNKIFENNKAHEINKMNHVVKQTGKNYIQNKVQVVQEMVRQTDLRNAQEKAAATQYAFHVLNKDFISILLVFKCVRCSA